MSFRKSETCFPLGRRGAFLASTARDFRINKWVYLMALPVLAYYVVFCYGPMYGAIIAFKDFRGGAGIWGSPWVGLKHFMSFFIQTAVGG